MTIAHIYCLLPPSYCLLPLSTYYCLLPNGRQFLLPTSHCLLPTSYCLLPLPPAYCLLLIAYTTAY